MEGEGGVGELSEGKGGGGVDTKTRVVGGDVLTTTLTQENHQHQGDRADNLDNIYKAAHSPQIIDLIDVRSQRERLYSFIEIV